VNQKPWRTIGLVLMVVVGAGGVLLPLLGVALLVFGSMMAEFPWGAAAYTLGSLALFSVVVGAWIAWQGIRGLMRRPSRPFTVPGRWLWVAGLAGLLLFLAVSKSVGGAEAGVLRILAAVLPACALLSLVSHRLKDAPAPATWRQVAAQTGSSLTVAIGWSLFWELLLIVAVALVAALAVGAVAPELFQEWGQSPIVSDADLLQHPAVMALLLVISAGIIPVIEEIGKFLAVGTLFLARRPSRAQILVWGIVSGAAFGVYEAALANPFTDPGVGAAVAVLRVGALLIHSCAAALTSLGFYEWIALRRPGRFFAGIGMAIGLHATWNALAIGLSAALSLGGSEVSLTLTIGLGAFFILSVGAGLILHRITEL